MQVILLQDVKTLGKKGEIVKKVREDEILSALKEEIDRA